MRLELKPPIQQPTHYSHLPPITPTLRRHHKQTRTIFKHGNNSFNARNNEHEEQAITKQNTLLGDGDNDELRHALLNNYTTRGETLLTRNQICRVRGSTFTTLMGYRHKTPRNGAISHNTLITLTQQLLDSLKLNSALR